MLHLTGILYDDSEPPPGYMVYCPELNVLTQGDSVEHARAMIQEAVEGVLEILPAEERERRLSGPWSSVDDIFAEEYDHPVVEVDRFTFAVESAVFEILSRNGIEELSQRGSSAGAPQVAVG